MKRHERKADMRRTDRQLTEQEAYNILDTGEYGILSTVSAEGIPYGVPISYAYRDGTIYMHCAAANGWKIHNLRSNQNASFTVVKNTKLLPDKFGTLYESVICFGTVEIVEENAEKRDGIEAILQKYSSDFIENGVKYIEGAINKIWILKFTVSEISGKGRKR